MMDTAGRVGGSQELATLLQGTQELMREAGGAGACVQMLKDGSNLAAAAGGAEQARIYTAVRHCYRIHCGCGQQPLLMRPSRTSNCCKPCARLSSAAACSLYKVLQ